MARIAKNFRTLAIQTFLIMAAIVIWPTGAFAQSCTATIGDVNFGDLTSPLPNSATAPVNVTCTAPAKTGTLDTGTRFLVCLHLGGGSGGEDLSTSTRKLSALTANQLTYQLYSNSGYSTVWGTAYWATVLPPPIYVQVPKAGGSASPSPGFTVYARIPDTAANRAAVPGNYLSNFTPAVHVVAQFYQGTTTTLNSSGSLPTNCSALTGTGFTASGPAFKVVARKQVSCTVSPTPLDFGSQSTLDANIDATGSLGVNCSPNLPYTVGLGFGQNGTSATTRKMALGANRVAYNIYLDSGRNSIWGNGPDDDVHGSGTGATQNITVYGRVPPQTTPLAGTYQDTVVVTVTY